MNSTGQSIYAAELDGSVWKSDNSGTNWAALSAPLANWTSIACDSSGQNVIAASATGVWISTNGSTFQQAMLPGSDWISVAISANGAVFYATALGNDVFQSLDAGFTWSALASEAGSWAAITCNGEGNTIAGILQPSARRLQSGNATRFIYISTVGGLSWTLTNAPALSWTSIAISDSGATIAAAASNAGVYLSTDTGATWSLIIAANSWYGVSMDSTGTLVAATTSTGQIWVANSFGPPTTAPTNAPGGSDDADGVLVDVGTGEGFSILLLSLIPAFCLILCPLLALCMRNNELRPQISVLAFSKVDAVVIVCRCLTWLFFVENILWNTVRGHPGLAALIISKIILWVMWAVIIGLLLVPVQEEERGVSFHSRRSNSIVHALTAPKTFSLQIFLHPAAKVRLTFCGLFDGHWYRLIKCCAVFDLRLFVYLPWKHSAYTDLSAGFPCFLLTKCCLFTSLLSDTVQAIATMCLMVYGVNRRTLDIVFFIFAAICMLRSFYLTFAVMMAYDEHQLKDDEVLLSMLQEDVRPRDTMSRIEEGRSTIEMPISKMFSVERSQSEINSQASTEAMAISNPLRYGLPDVASSVGSCVSDMSDSAPAVRMSTFRSSLAAAKRKAAVEEEEEDDEEEEVGRGTEDAQGGGGDGGGGVGDEIDLGGEGY